MQKHLIVARLTMFLTAFCCFTIGNIAISSWWSSFRWPQQTTIFMTLYNPKNYVHKYPIGMCNYKSCVSHLYWTHVVSGCPNERKCYRVNHWLALHRGIQLLFDQREQDFYYAIKRRQVSGFTCKHCHSWGRFHCSQLSRLSNFPLHSKSSSHPGLHKSNK